MLNKILSISLQNRLLILLGAVALSVLGAYSARTMNIDVFPDLTAPTVTILTEAHGMESEEVEKLVTYQLETALNGSPNVRRIRSSSAAGISIVWIDFRVVAPFFHDFSPNILFENFFVKTYPQVLEHQLWHPYHPLWAE